MANEEQGKRLLEDVEGWHLWRQEYPDELIDLARANLNRTNPFGANLR